MNNNDKRIDDIISMLDNFTAQNGGHMNIEVNKDGNINSKKINKSNSLECASGNLSCNVPTLFEGVED